MDDSIPAWRLLWVCIASNKRIKRLPSTSAIHQEDQFPVFRISDIPLKKEERIIVAEIPAAWIAILQAKTILQMVKSQRSIHLKMLPSQSGQKIADLARRITSYYF